MLLAVLVLLSATEVWAQRRRVPTEQARQLCERYHRDRLGASRETPSSVCTNERLISVFSNSTSRRMYDACYSFMSNQSDSSIRPHALCRTASYRNAFGSRANRMAFKECYKHITENHVSENTSASDVCVRESILNIFKNDSKSSAFKSCRKFLGLHNRGEQQPSSRACEEDSLLTVFATDSDLREPYDACHMFMESRPVRLLVNEVSATSSTCSREAMIGIFQNTERRQAYMRCIDRGPGSYEGITPSVYCSSFAGIGRPESQTGTLRLLRGTDRGAASGAGD